MSQAVVISDGSATIELDLYSDSAYQNQVSKIQIGLNVTQNAQGNGFIVTLSDLVNAQFNSWTAYTVTYTSGQPTLTPVGGVGGTMNINSGSSGWQIPVDTTNQDVILSFGYQGMWTEGLGFQLWGPLYPSELGKLNFLYQSPTQMTVGVSYTSPVLTSSSNPIPSKDPSARLIYLRPNPQQLVFTFGQPATTCGGTSEGVYPNCTCPQADYYYNPANNDCELKQPCPTEHCSTCSGQFVPNCNCDSGYTLQNGICVPVLQCPTNSTGTYPNCNCGSNALYDSYNNVCRAIVCPSCAPGTYPNCTPTSKCYSYDPTQNTCDPLFTYCPSGASGTYPNCICPNNGTYDCTTNTCTSPNTTQCPANASGTYPNCTCTIAGYSYNQSSNSCIPTQQMTCPSGSTGTYPNCTCTTAGYVYSQSTNTCVPSQQMSCPIGASGTYPNCVCPNGYSYNLSTNSCISVGSNTTPWYQNIWIWIAAGGAGILVLLLILVFRRK